MMLHKGDFIKNLALKKGISQPKAAEIVEAVLTGIQDELVAGNGVTFTGFGKFDVVHRSERKGRNPKTKEEILIAATTVAKFSAGKTLKEAVKK